MRTDHQQQLSEMLARVHQATSAVQLGTVEQSVNVANRHLNAQLSEVYPGWFTPEGVEPVAVNIDSPTYHIQSPAAVRTGPQYYPPQYPPRRSLWPWLVAGVALGVGGAVAVPLLLDAARQTAPQPAPAPPVVIQDQPPVINLPEARDPGRYFLKPGRPLDR